MTILNTDNKKKAKSIADEKFGSPNYLKKDKNDEEKKKKKLTTLQEMLLKNAKSPYEKFGAVIGISLNKLLFNNKNKKINKNQENKNG